MKEVRVIVVGAGPAGSTAAYRLAQQGIRVILLDQAVFPRYKACGGGILAKAKQILPIKEEWFEVETASVTISHRYRDPIRSKYEYPYTMLVNRERFDHRLLTMAKEAGVEVFEGIRIVGAVEETGQVEVHSAEGSKFTADYLFAADGAKSEVARSLCLPQYRSQLGVALEGEYVVQESQYQKFCEIIQINYGSIPSGYSWIFPKDGYLSCGIGTFHPRYVGLRQKLNEYLQKSGIQVKETLCLKGAQIPVGGINQVFSGERTFLLGDAAGLVDPITGEGIYYALRSAQLAVSTLLRVIGGTGEVKDYDRVIQQEIGQELSRARRGSWVIFSCSAFVHHILRDNPELVRMFQRVCCGDAKYSEFFQMFYKKIPGTLFKNAVSLLY